uniref:Secreted protein n=1 Tax=Myotis myotis TaxID=51298 RepID=A0A7J7SRB4_MYOMY|nr:hypothetical protein mMyoMyo1_009279 [Myotis myotis]
MSLIYCVFMYVYMCVHVCACTDTHVPVGWTERARRSSLVRGAVRLGSKPALGSDWKRELISVNRRAPGVAPERRPAHCAEWGAGGGCSLAPGPNEAQDEKGCHGRNCCNFKAQELLEISVIYDVLYDAFTVPRIHRGAGPPSRSCVARKPCPHPPEATPVSTQGPPPARHTREHRVL